MAIQIDRRVFLAGCAISAAGAAPARRRVRIGFLGASHSHGADKVRLAAKSPDFELMGVYEPDERVRQALAPAGVKFISQEQVIDATEAIAVESPVRDLARFAGAALSAGKHVHVEKPPADTMAKMETLLRLARERGVVFQVGYMWRHNPGVIEIFRIVREGWLGKVWLARGMMNTSLAGNRRAEWAEFAGGAMFEQGCHLLDPMVRLLGAPRSISTTLRRHGPHADDFKDNNAVVLEFDGALGVLTNSTLHGNAGPYRSLEVFGENGSAVLRPIEPPSLLLDLNKAAGPYRAGLQTVNVGAYQRYVGDFEELAAAVRGERKLSVTLDQERSVHETVLAASGMK